MYHILSLSLSLSLSLPFILSNVNRECFTSKSKKHDISVAFGSDLLPEERIRKVRCCRFMQYLIYYLILFMLK